ncbi:hypothetical protein FOCC_FOCC006803 [Frankliniella occidentalis]|nr:hypothetical protein FOCC_FOCC006803 [Frankliniella occidentalis]
MEPTPHSSSFNMGYLVSPYPYHNGAAGPIPVSMVSESLLQNFQEKRKNRRNEIFQSMSFGNIS